MRPHLHNYTFPHSASTEAPQFPAEVEPTEADYAKAQRELEYSGEFDAADLDERAQEIAEEREEREWDLALAEAADSRVDY